MAEPTEAPAKAAPSPTRRAQMKAKAAKALRGFIAVKACEVAAGQAANVLERAYRQSRRPKSACESLGSWSSWKANMSSCAKVAQESCSAAVGAVRVDHLLPNIPPENITQQMLVMAANQAVGSACKAGGVAALCGVISVAAGQIKEAVQTGNNSIARCAGTDRMGACLGEWWVGKNTGPVATARGTGANESRLCCMCQADYYADNWTADTLLTSELYTGVTDNGPWRRSHCYAKERTKHPQGKTFKGKPIYKYYSKCANVRVRGNTCHVPARGSVTVLESRDGHRWRGRLRKALRSPARVDRGETVP